MCYHKKARLFETFDLFLIYEIYVRFVQPEDTNLFCAEVTFKHKIQILFARQCLYITQGSSVT